MAIGATKAARASAQVGRGRGTLSHGVVLDVAARLFNAKGFDRTSMNDIAEELGVTKPSIYYYFPSKDAILVGAIKEAGASFEGKVRQVINDGRAPYDQFRDVIRLYLEGMRWEVFRTLILADERTLSRSGKDQVIKSKRRINEAVEALIRRAEEKGQMSVVNAHYATFAIFGMLNWMALWRRGDWSKNAEEIEATFEQMILSGVAGNIAPKPSGRR